VKLGVDIYSLRWQGWDALQLLEYCHALGVDVVHYSDVGCFASLDERYLAELRDRAMSLGMGIEVGMGSICPTSTTFRREKGPAAEQVERMLRVAHTLGSSTLRCYLGANADRQTATPLKEHIAATVATCRAVRPLALELGVKLAIENHSGDLQGRELAGLIEQAGVEHVGACIDAGNPFYVVESPFVTLDHLAPYVVTSHVRDTAVWEHPRGAAMQWVAMGDGNIGIDRWATRYAHECPQSSFTLEIITGRNPQVLPYLEPGFWTPYPDTPAEEFVRFMGLARAGQPFIGPMLTAARGDVPGAYEPAFVLQQRVDLERSVRYCREVLKVGEGA
jgi:sugar phosphate isomerase/epimerase